MDIAKAVAQTFIVGVKGTKLDEKQLAKLASLGVGGVVLFKQNYENLRQLVDLVNSIQKAVLSKPDAVPAWIAVDHEGGRVQRFGAPFTAFPPAAKWGEINSPKTAFEAGYVMAKELRAVGVNINFCPVVDVPPTMTAPALGDRVFSTDPEVVANLGSATVRGLQKGGVLGVIKHFPGHGAATVDSHVDLPVVNKSVADLEALDWIPFRRAIRARAEGVMTAHISMPQLDAEKCATFSRKILQEHLRKSLRHAKLIFSDDLDMGAIRNKYETKEAAYFTLEAGSDHVLICHSWDEIESAHEYVTKAFETGALSQKRLEETAARIADAKQRYITPYREVKYAEAEAVVGCDAFKAVAQAIAEGRAVEKGPSGSEENA